MTKQIIFSDVAGTIVVGNPWDYIRKHPNYDQRRGERERWKFLPTYFARKVGLVSDTTFRQRWLYGVATSLGGKSQDEIQTIYRETVAEQMNDLFRQDVLERLQGYRAEGLPVYLVSGMFQDLVQVFADHVELDGAIGTQMAYDENGISLGRIEGKTCIGPDKPDFVEAFLAQHHPEVTLADCMGFADSYSDRSLLEAVGHGVATYPDDQLREVALNKGWEIHPATVS